MADTRQRNSTSPRQITLPKTWNSRLQVRLFAKTLRAHCRSLSIAFFQPLLAEWAKAVAKEQITGPPSHGQAGCLRYTLSQVPLGSCERADCRPDGRRRLCSPLSLQAINLPLGSAGFQPADLREHRCQQQVSRKRQQAAGEHVAPRPIRNANSSAHEDLRRQSERVIAAGELDFRSRAELD